MDPNLFLSAVVISIIAAAALWRMIKPGTVMWRGIAAAVGLAAFVGLLVNVGLVLIDEVRRPEAFFLVFSLIAVASAVRMITHDRPVYSALYFIMVVLSSAALFLLLQAEFMAFALVIVYAGAILITYMFVLMLAQQASDPDNEFGAAEYDINPREPAAASAVAFVMLALLSNMIYDGADALPTPPSPTEANLAMWRAIDEMPGKRTEVIRDVAPEAQVLFDETGDMVRFRDGEAYIEAIPPGSNRPEEIMLTEAQRPTNVELIGYDLIARFPVSLELAGVILLMAMYGAVILARRQIELSEDEVREAAGMARTSFEALESEATGGGAP